MSLNTILQRTWGRHGGDRQCRAGSPRRSLVLEVLEDRTVPAAVPILGDTSMLASPIAAPAAVAPAAAPIAAAALYLSDVGSMRRFSAAESGTVKSLVLVPSGTASVSFVRIEDLLALAEARLAATVEAGDHDLVNARRDAVALIDEIEGPSRQRRAQDGP